MIYSWGKTFCSIFTSPMHIHLIELKKDSMCLLLVMIQRQQRCLTPTPNWSLQLLRQEKVLTDGTTSMTL